MNINWSGRRTASDEQRKRIDAEIQTQLLNIENMEALPLLNIAFMLDHEIGRELLANHVSIYTSREIEENHDELIDQCYGSEINICGCFYAASKLLKETDPIAYRCSFLEYIESYVDVCEELGIDEAHYRYVNIMVQRDEWAGLDFDEVDFREEILDRMPELQSEIDAYKLEQGTKCGTASCSLSLVDVNALVPANDPYHSAMTQQPQSRRL